jgi:ribosomal-protein-alanine N-acetyltransferase
MSVAIEPAGPAHAAILARLQNAWMAGDWSAESIRRLLALPGACALLALDAPERPCGFVLCIPGGDGIDIAAIAVEPARRRGGVGRALLAAALARLPGVAVTLEVAADNAPALALYRAAGFVAAGRRAGYYRRAEGAVDALLMRRPAEGVGADDPPIPRDRVYKSRER